MVIFHNNFVTLLSEGLQREKLEWKERRNQASRQVSFCTRPCSSSRRSLLVTLNTLRDLDITILHIRTVGFVECATGSSTRVKNPLSNLVICRDGEYKDTEGVSLGIGDSVSIYGCSCDFGSLVVQSVVVPVVEFQPVD